MSINLAQREADALFRMEKYQADNKTYNYPASGGKCAVPLVSADGREEFIFDIYRRRVEFVVKGTYQNRTKGHIVLVRLDFGGPPHRNPDDEEIGSPHLHHYRENYDNKWAYPLPKEFSDSSDPYRMLKDFMRYCRITGVGITLPLKND